MMTEDEKKTICKLLAIETLGLLRTSLVFQDKNPYYHNISKFSGISYRYNSYKLYIKHLKKLSLVSGLLLDLIVNKPEIIISMIANLYENHLNLLKEGKISADKRFSSFLAQNIKVLLSKNITFLASRSLISTDVNNFIFEVCESLLQKNTDDLIKIVEKQSIIIIKMLLEDEDVFKAYVEFLDIYSFILEVIDQIHISLVSGREIVSPKGSQYVQRTLEFYRKFYKKLYSELELWQKLFKQNTFTVIENIKYIPKLREELNFAFAFTIYYLMVKTIECIARTSAMIIEVTTVNSDDRDKEINIKTQLKKLIIDCLLDTYMHFCENVLLDPWCKDSVGNGIYRCFSSTHIPSYRTVAATLLEQAYKSIHKDLEFDLLYQTIWGKTPDNLYKDYKLEIFRIVRCKSIIKKWVRSYLCHDNKAIWETNFEKE